MEKQSEEWLSWRIVIKSTILLWRRRGTLVCRLPYTVVFRAHTPSLFIQNSTVKVPRIRTCCLNFRLSKSTVFDDSSTEALVVTDFPFLSYVRSRPSLLFGVSARYSTWKTLSVFSHSLFLPWLGQVHKNIILLQRNKGVGFGKGKVP